MQVWKESGCPSRTYSGSTQARASIPRTWPDQVVAPSRLGGRCQHTSEASNGRLERDMEQRVLGKSGLKVSAIGMEATPSWHGGRRRGDSPDPPRDRPGSDLHRHRRQLQRRQVRGVDRQGGRAATRRRGDRHQGRLVTARHPAGRLPVAPLDHAGGGELPAPPRTDYIDLYQAHRPDEVTPLEETLRAMDDLVRQGKVRYIGCSNYAAWQLAQAMGICRAEKLTPWVSTQPRWNLIDGLADPYLLPPAASMGSASSPTLRLPPAS